MVLAGRGSYEHHVGGNKFDYATFLALTYFFPNSACWGSVTEHTQWVQTIQNAIAQHAAVAFQVPEPILIALEVGSCRNFHSSPPYSIHLTFSICSMIPIGQTPRTRVGQLFRPFSIWPILVSSRMLPGLSDGWMRCTLALE